MVKNYIIIADVCSNTQFLVWREADLSLTLLARDRERHMALATEVIADDAQLAIVLSDWESNLEVLHFNPRFVSFIIILILLNPQTVSGSVRDYIH